MLRMVRWQPQFVRKITYELSGKFSSAITVKMRQGSVSKSLINYKV